MNYDDIIRELRAIQDNPKYKIADTCQLNVSWLARDCADFIEQQAARIAELEEENSIIKAELIHIDNQLAAANARAERAIADIVIITDASKGLCYTCAVDGTYESGGCYFRQLYVYKGEEDKA